jgi:hypothetical protein
MSDMDGILRGYYLLFVVLPSFFIISSIIMLFLWGITHVAIQYYRSRNLPKNPNTIENYYQKIAENKIND